MAQIGPTHKLVMNVIIRIRIKVKVHLFACARVFVCMQCFESSTPNHRRYYTRMSHLLKAIDST